jgi:hypothetical protein
MARLRTPRIRHVERPLGSRYKLIPKRQQFPRFSNRRHSVVRFLRHGAFLAKRLKYRYNPADINAARDGAVDAVSLKPSVLTDQCRQPEENQDDLQGMSRRSKRMVSSLHLGVVEVGGKFAATGCTTQIIQALPPCASSPVIYGHSARLGQELHRRVTRAEVVLLVGGVLGAMAGERTKQTFSA